MTMESIAEISEVYISAQRIAIQKVYRALWRRVKDEEIYPKEYRSGS